MTIVVDANVAIAVLDSRHPFHRAAIGRCLTADGVVIMNMTRAEALIHPSRLQQLDEADEVLDQLGFRTEPLTNDVADQARALRAEYGNRSFPMVDAVVVAFGVVHRCPIVICDQKWPEISEADIEVLAPE